MDIKQKDLAREVIAHIRSSYEVGDRVVAIENIRHIPLGTLGTLIEIYRDWTLEYTIQWDDPTGRGSVFTTHKSGARGTPYGFRRHYG